MTGLFNIATEHWVLSGLAAIPVLYILMMALCLTAAAVEDASNFFMDQMAQFCARFSTEELIPMYFDHSTGKLTNRLRFVSSRCQQFFGRHIWLIHFVEGRVTEFEYAILEDGGRVYRHRRP